MGRRRLLQGAALAPLALAGCGRSGEADERVFQPADTDALAHWFGTEKSPASVRGAGFSMGGQTQCQNGTQIDLRKLRGVVAFDPQNQWIRVGAGMTWRSLIEAIDPYDLAVKIMQSYSNFSIGGSLSVNCHGRYVGAGPIVNSVRALQLITPDGRAHELRPGDPLFGAVVGGYGAIGVITEVELDLVPNTKMQRQVQWAELDTYPAFFKEAVEGKAVLHNADLMPPDFDAPFAVSWVATDEPLTVADRLVPIGSPYTDEQWKIWAVSELPNGHKLRSKYQTSPMQSEAPVAWRNHEASLDARSLSGLGSVSEYLLQEFFIPTEGFGAFAQELREVLDQNNTHTLNVSIRHSPADTHTLLPWAKQETFSFVLYHKQRLWLGDRSARTWSRRLIDAALDKGGRHYLPYRLHATSEQAHRGYPGIDALRQIKAEVDPSSRMRNLMWDAYLAG